LSLQATGLALSDLDGDGNDDIVEANHLSNYDVPQRVFFLSASSAITSSYTLTSLAGRTAAVGNIFPDSPLPDIALGTSDGRVVLFSNLGVDNTGEHLGFEQRNTLDTNTGGAVRDLFIWGSFSQDSVIIACAVVDNPNHVFYTSSFSSDASTSISTSLSTSISIRTSASTNVDEADVAAAFSSSPLVGSLMGALIAAVICRH